MDLKKIKSAAKIMADAGGHIMTMSTADVADLVALVERQEEELRGARFAADSHLNTVKVQAAVIAGAPGEHPALSKLCDQLDSMTRTMFLRPGTGQNYSYLVHEDVAAYVQQARDSAGNPTLHHPDDSAVDRFAAAMKAKMAASRAKGRGGWDNEMLCPVERLQSMLRDHIAKGDPVDVGNFCMMLFNRNAATAALAQAAPASPASAPVAPDLISACRELIAYVDASPPMADSLWCVQKIRAALASKVTPTAWALLAECDPQATIDPELADYWKRKGRTVTALYAAPLPPVVARKVLDWISVDERLPELGQSALVFTPSPDPSHPEDFSLGFDCIDPSDDDRASWLNHNEHYEHFCCVAKPEGSTGPREKAPYTHWMPLPDAPVERHLMGGE